MTSIVNLDLQIPYEIGIYIAKEFSIELSERFYKGPDPEINQMVQGIFLQMNTYTNQPIALLTRYGMWSFDFAGYSSETNQTLEIFKKLREKLQLVELTIDVADGCCGYWGISNWDGQKIADPVLELKEDGGIPVENAKREIQGFLKK